MALLLGCEAGTVRGDPSPEAVGAIPLASPGAFLQEQREAALAVAAELRSSEEEPSEFFATVTDSRDTLVFHLWHESAFAPENAKVAGNPGGKCRDAYYDKATRAITKVLYWQ